MADHEPYQDASRPKTTPDSPRATDGVGGEDAREAAARRSRVELTQKYIMWGFGGVLGVVLLFVIGFLLFLQTERGRETGRNFIVERLNTLVDGAEFSAAELGGNFIGRIALYDLALVRADGEAIIRADTFSARYSLIQLLRNRLAIRNIDLINPRVWMEQEADGTWDLFNVIARDDSAAVDTADSWATRLVIGLDHLTVVDGQIDARFYPPDADSVLLVRNLVLDMGDAEFGQNPIFEVDSLVARFSPPAQDYWASLRLGATLGDSLLTVNGFELDSPRSMVRSGGSLSLPRRDRDMVSAIDFSLTASPLAFDDINAFVPGLRRGASVQLDVRMGGSEETLLVDADAAFSDGATLDLNGTIAPSEPNVAYELAGTLRGLDLSMFTSDPGHASSINADLTVDLAGAMLDALDGSANAQIYDTRFGDLRLERTTIDTRWRGGQAEIDARGGLREASFTLAGSMRPFDETPSYDVNGRVRGFNVGNFTDGTNQSDLNATIAVDGRGFDPQRAHMTIDVAVAPSTFNNYRIDYGSLDAILNEGRLTFGTRFQFPDGEAFAQGQADFTGSEITYSVGRGTISNMDLAALLGADAPSSVNASFSAEGVGTDPMSMSLRATLDVFDSRYADVNIAAADVNVSVRNGSMQANAAADMIEAGAFSLRAEGRPFDDVPVIDVTSGEYRDLDLGRITQNPSLQTDLDGSAVFRIRGFEGDRMRVQGRIDLDPSRVNEQTIDRAFAVVDLESGHLALNSQIDMPEGQIRLSGSAEPFRDVPTYTIDDGRFSNVNLAALSGSEGMQTELTGTFVGSGRGFDPATMVFDGRLEVAPSRINQQDINRMTAQFSVQRGLLTLDTAVDLPEGDVQLVASLDLQADEPTYVIDRGQFENLNLGALTGNPDLETRLTGTISAEGRGFDPSTMVLDGTLTLSDSRVNEQVIDSVTVTGSIRDAELDFAARMIAPEGITDLAGAVDFSGDELAYRISRGDLQGIDVGALIGNPNLRTRLTGTLTLEGRGTDPESMNLVAALDFSRSEINRAVVTDGQLTATVDAGLLTFDGDLSFVNGSADVQGRARFFQEEPSYEVVGSVQNVDLGALMGTDTLRSVLTAEFDLAGRGLDPQTMTVQGTVRSDTIRYQDAIVSNLDARFELDAGYLQVDTLVLRSNFADVNAYGEIALFGTQTQYASDFTFRADVYEVEPIRQFIPADVFALDSGFIEGRVYGRPGRLQFDANTDITSFVYNDIRISGLEGHFSGQVGQDGRIELAEFDAAFDYLTLPFIAVRSSNITATYQGDRLLFSGVIRFAHDQSANVEGSIDLREDVQQVTLERFDLDLTDQDWSLLIPATITYGDAYRVSNFLLESEDGQIAVDGIVDPDGTQNLVFTIESMQFGAIAGLLGFPGLSGTLDGEVDLTGPAYAPNLDGALSFDLASRGNPVGDLDLDVRYDSLRLNLDALLNHVDGGTLAINGYVPADLSLAPADSAAVGDGVRVRAAQTAPESDVNLVIQADSFDIAWIDPFLDEEVMQNVGGTLTAEIDVTGTFEDPVLDGALSLHNGRIRLPEFNVTYRDLNMAARLDENRLEFENAELRSGDGTLTASGSVALAQLTLGEFDINAQLNQFLAVRNAQYHITTSGDLQLAGTTRQPEVSGRIQLVQTDIYLDEATGADIAEAELTDRDIRMLEERFNYQVTALDTAVSVFYENLTLDLTVSMARNTWIRQRAQPEMAIQFEGSLDVQKQPGGDPQIFGTIEVIPQRSYIDQFSRRFNISSGTITFNGDPTNFYMDVAAEYSVKSRSNPGQAQVVITLGLRGQLDDLEFTLGSNPTLSETDILSYIATGQPAGQTLQLADASSMFVSGSAGLALNEVATVLEGIAGEGLGLDVIEIQHDGLRGAVLIAGKYVSPRVYVGVSQPVAFNTSSSIGESLSAGTRSRTEVTLEYEVFNWLLFRLSGGTSTLRGNLLWEHAY